MDALKFFVVGGCFHVFPRKKTKTRLFEALMMLALGMLTREFVPRYWLFLNIFDHQIKRTTLVQGVA
jgi:hypothetical protein